MPLNMAVTISGKVTGVMIAQQQREQAKKVHQYKRRKKQHAIFCICLRKNRTLNRNHRPDDQRRSRAGAPHLLIFDQSGRDDQFVRVAAPKAVNATASTTGGST